MLLAGFGWFCQLLLRTASVDRTERALRIADRSRLNECVSPIVKVGPEGTVSDERADASSVEGTPVSGHHVLVA